jgi:hypothetical protein
VALEHPHLSEGPPSGLTLDLSVARSGTLPPERLLRLDGELAQALSYLHASGVRHGALTPAAVCLRPDGSAFLALDAPAPKEGAGWIPFEQAAGKPVPASDLYQLGATLLFASSGREPRDAGLPTNWRGDASLKGPLGELIVRLVDPRWDRRPGSAAAAAQEIDDIAMGRPTRGQRRRRRAAGAALAALMAIGGVSAIWRVRSLDPAPPPVTAPIHHEPIVRAGAWVSVPDLHWDVKGLQLSEAGGIWVFTRWEAAKFPDGTPGSPRKTLTDITVVARDNVPSKEGRAPFKPEYANGVAVGESAFMGGTDGEVLRGTLSGAPAAKPPALGSKGRVTGMAWSDGTLYAAWNGRLWAWREGAAAWTRPGAGSPTGVHSILVSSDKSVYAGGSTGLWRHDGSGWKRIWKGGGRDDAISALAQGLQGRILAGTNDGFITVDAEGDTLGRELRGRRVSAFTELDNGRFWVGTFDEGLFVRENGTWRPFGYAYGLVSDAVTSVAVDRSGTLWVGFLGGGGVVVRAEAEAAAAAREAKPPSPLVGDVYGSPQEAARRNLVEGTPVGGVARLKIGGRDFIYFDGHQVAPPGPGSLGTDGSSARVENGRWILRRPDGGETVLPELPARTHVAHSLLGRGGQLYLAGDSGILVFDAGAWLTLGREAGLDANPVQDLHEDGAGNLWVATSPPFHRGQGKYLRKNLHRFDGKSWTSWSPDDGLGYWATWAVQPLPDGSVAAATNGGLSILRAGKVTTFGNANGFPDPAAFWISADGSGRMLLVGFRKGVALSEGLKFRRVTTRQGLFSNDLTAAATDADGRVWLLARDGRTFVLRREILRAAAR